MEPFADMAFEDRHTHSLLAFAVPGRPAAYVVADSVPDYLFEGKGHSVPCRTVVSVAEVVVVAVALGQH